jgi:ABC-type phosphate transport system substrate-binding protein
MFTVAGVAALAGMMLTAGPADAVLADRGRTGGYAAIGGSGSSYEYLYLSQWINDVQSQGLTVHYNPDGTPEGLINYINGHTVDFAGSDLPFRTTRDKLAQTTPQHVPWGFSYVPGVALGVAFMYHISVHGHLYRDLRLSGQTLMEIFTGQITNWDNPQITRETGTQLPDLPITPVIRADGSGVTYYFSRWMAHQFPGQWNAFCDTINPQITPPCGPTAFYPVFGHARAENGANNVADFITSSAGQGAIGYVESPYASFSSYPVLALGNAAGQYVRPGARNVHAALAAASIYDNPAAPDYLEENLNRVYTSTNPASYPLSAYSYIIVPRAGAKPTPPIFNAAAGKSLSAFLLYTLCTGQSQLGSAGIAALPSKIVDDGLQMLDKIPGHVPLPGTCPNTR